VRLLATPLVYARRAVGILVVTRRGGGDFTRNDGEVFASIAEQSAFALGSALVHQEAAEKRRFERELNQASEIQRVLLPRSAPELSDYEIAAEYKAARHVSGDYYDYVRVDDDRYGIAIGDVCGKGIAASLIMAMCRSNLRSRAPENLSPASVLHSVNHSIFPDIREDMFVSLLYLILERGSREVTMARAGHEPPVIYRKATGTTEIIETSGLAAGIDEGPVFKRSVKDYRFRMDSGDILLLYTDGVIECENPAGDEFGIDRLCALLVEHHERSSQEIVNAVIAEVARFTAGAPQSDDITLIAIEKR
jgi:sigma-B regulation protein RsbU (phosphoserine phosphatase)